MAYGPRKLTPEQTRRMFVDLQDGMSQRAAGRKYGISQQTVSYYLRRVEKPRPPVDPCGTNGGYYRHKRSGDPVCTECWAAHAAHQKRYRDNRARK